MSVSMRFLGYALLAPLALLAACSSPMGERMGQSLAVMRGFQSGEHAIPTTVFENARGIAILREGSGALVVGGSGGKGVYMQRAGFGWSAPVAIDTSSLSIGLQAGVQSRDIVIVFNTDDEVRTFLDDGVYGLAEAAAVAGPSKSDGKNAGGPVPATYYYIRNEGFFGGILVGGVLFSTNSKVDEGEYGKGVTIEEIVSGKVRKPAGQQVLEQSLN